MKKTVSVKLNREDIVDILSMVDDCSYWCNLLDWEDEDYEQAKNKCKTFIDDVCREDVWSEILLNNKSLVFVDDEEERNELTLDKLEKGVAKVIEEGYWNGKDNGDIDGEIADIIIQTSIYGEIVYG